MNETLLHLKDGQCRAFTPFGRELGDILHYLRTPAAAAGKTLRLQLPAGGTTDVVAGDIKGLEIPPPYVLVPDFLTDAELAQVEDFTMAHLGAFQNSGVHAAPGQGNTATEYGIRRSRVLDDPANGVLAAMIMPKLQNLLPKLWPQLRLNPIPLNSLECQVTAHGDGDFFATHTDNGMPEIAYRRMSYVYYFHREPKQFTGGHLCLYNTLYQAAGYGACGRLAAGIDPPRNGLMVFPTFIFHEVTPIQCASTAFTDQRLTLNGWLF